MITVITKKENKLNCTSYKGIQNFKKKRLKYFIYILVSKLKGYEIEVLER